MIRPILQHRFLFTAFCGAAVCASVMVKAETAEMDIQAYSEPYSCGAISLTLLLRLEGFPATPEQIQSLLPDRERHSLFELQQAAHSQGLLLRGIQLRASDWPLDRPIIVHLERRSGGHFVVVRSVGHSGRLVQIIDPVSGSEVRDIGNVLSSKVWTGFALVPERLSDNLPIYSKYLGLVILCVVPLLVWRTIASRSRRLHEGAGGYRG